MGITVNDTSVLESLMNVVGNEIEASYPKIENKIAENQLQRANQQMEAVDSPTEIVPTKITNGEDERTGIEESFDEDDEIEYFKRRSNLNKQLVDFVDAAGKRIFNTDKEALQAFEDIKQQVIQENAIFDKRGYELFVSKYGSRVANIEELNNAQKNGQSYLWNIFRKIKNSTNHTVANIVASAAEICPSNIRHANSSSQ